MYRSPVDHCKLSQNLQITFQNFLLNLFQKASKKSDLKCISLSFDCLGKIQLHRLQHRSNNITVKYTEKILQTLPGKYLDTRDT